MEAWLILSTPPEPHAPDKGPVPPFLLSWNPKPTLPSGKDYICHFTGGGTAFPLMEKGRWAGALSRPSTRGRRPRPDCITSLCRGRLQPPPAAESVSSPDLGIIPPQIKGKCGPRTLSRDNPGAQLLLISITSQACSPKSFSNGCRSLQRVLEISDERTRASLGALGNKSGKKN